MVGVTRHTLFFRKGIFAAATLLDGLFSHLQGLRFVDPNPLTGGIAAVNFEQAKEETLWPEQFSPPS